MGNINRACNWPNCECQTAKGDPCKFENPDFYVNKAREVKPMNMTVTQKEGEHKRSDVMFAQNMMDELVRARTKFPSSVLCHAALMEEVGELAQAMLKYAAGKWPIERVYEEAIQVAAMAARCAIEGDPAFKLLKYEEPEMSDNQ